MPLSGPALPAFETACDLIERILAAADGLTSDQLDAAPWDDSSTIFILATHAISATEWNFVEVLAEQQVDRSRQAEFDSRAASVDDPQGLLAERWAGARAAIESALADLSDDAWDGPHYHMFMDRNLSGHELVVRALSHTAEHVGHAEMTRQWLDAR
ncbi:MAG: DinB family protein [Chloroflexota bacterium]|nr:DinB family protein [Chloroflexota bacterium]